MVHEPSQPRGWPSLPIACPGYSPPCHRTASYSHARRSGIIGRPLLLSRWLGTANTAHTKLLRARDLIQSNRRVVRGAWDAGDCSKLPRHRGIARDISTVLRRAERRRGYGEMDGAPALVF